MQQIFVTPTYILTQSNKMKTLSASLHYCNKENGSSAIKNKSEMLKS